MLRVLPELSGMRQSEVEVVMKVLVGLSGGVDSAVAAYLLKQQGHDVSCAFMRNWDSMANNDFLGNPTLGNDVCPQEKDYMDAKAVAEKLGLELLRIDFIKEYWDYVFTSFIENYKKGRTPNPDILCNKYIKFASFFDFAMEKGFDMIAMGHYAKVVHQEGDSILLKAADLNKDQTYFLAQLPKKALKKTLFPLGDITKPEVRRIAEELDLSIAKKKDSTGICFIGERNFREFLKNYLPAKSGDIIDIENHHVLKQHEGVLYYTIGQRKGLDIGGEGGPWFVIGKDVEKNELYVSKGENNPWLYSDKCRVSGINWFKDEIPNEELTCCVKFRYRQQDNPCRIKFIDKTQVYVYYPQKVSAVTPGQQAVFYLNDECLGGGVIEEVYNEEVELNERIMRKLNED